jgi:hypothetical protein
VIDTSFQRADSALCRRRHNHKIGTIGDLALRRAEQLITFSDWRWSALRMQVSA